MSSSDKEALPLKERLNSKMGTAIADRKLARDQNTRSLASLLASVKDNLNVILALENDPYFKGKKINARKIKQLLECIEIFHGHMKDMRLKRNKELSYLYYGELLESLILSKNMLDYLASKNELGEHGKKLKRDIEATIKEIESERLLISPEVTHNVLEQTEEQRLMLEAYESLRAEIMEELSKIQGIINARVNNDDFLEFNSGIFISRITELENKIAKLSESLHDEQISSYFAPKDLLKAKEEIQGFKESIIDYQAKTERLSINLEEINQLIYRFASESQEEFLAKIKQFILEKDLKGGKTGNLKRFIRTLQSASVQSSIVDPALYDGVCSIVGEVANGSSVSEELMEQVNIVFLQDPSYARLVFDREINHIKQIINDEILPDFKSAYAERFNSRLGNAFEKCDVKVILIERMLKQLQDWLEIPEIQSALDDKALTIMNGIGEIEDNLQLIKENIDRCRFEEGVFHNLLKKLKEGSENEFCDAVMKFIDSKLINEENLPLLNKYLQAKAIKDIYPAIAAGVYEGVDGVRKEYRNYHETILRDLFDSAQNLGEKSVGASKQYSNENLNAFADLQVYYQRDDIISAQEIMMNCQDHIEGANFISILNAIQEAFEKQYPSRIKQITNIYKFLRGETNFLNVQELLENSIDLRLIFETTRNALMASFSEKYQLLSQDERNDLLSQVSVKLMQNVAPQLTPEQIKELTVMNNSLAETSSRMEKIKNIVKINAKQLRESGVRLQKASDDLEVLSLRSNLLEAIVLKEEEIETSATDQVRLESSLLLLQQQKEQLSQRLSDEQAEHRLSIRTKNKELTAIVAYVESSKREFADKRKKIEFRIKEHQNKANEHNNKMNELDRLLRKITDGDEGIQASLAELRTLQTDLQNMISKSELYPELSMSTAVSEIEQFSKSIEGTVIKLSESVQTHEIRLQERPHQIKEVETMAIEVKAAFEDQVVSKAIPGNVQGQIQSEKDLDLSLGGLEEGTYSDLTVEQFEALENAVRQSNPAALSIVLKEIYLKQIPGHINLLLNCLSKFIIKDAEKSQKTLDPDILSNKLFLYRKMFECIQTYDKLDELARWQALYYINYSDYGSHLSEVDEELGAIKHETLEDQGARRIITKGLDAVKTISDSRLRDIQSDFLSIDQSLTAFSDTAPEGVRIVNKTHDLRERVPRQMMVTFQQTERGAHDNNSKKKVMKKEQLLLVDKSISVRQKLDDLAQKKRSLYNKYIQKAAERAKEIERLSARIENLKQEIGQIEERLSRVKEGNAVELNRISQSLALAEENEKAVGRDHEFLLVLEEELNNSILVLEQKEKEFNIHFKDTEAIYSQLSNYQVLLQSFIERTKLQTEEYQLKEREEALIKNNVNNIIQLLEKTNVETLSNEELKIHSGEISKWFADCARYPAYEPLALTMLNKYFQRELGAIAFLTLEDAKSYVLEMISRKLVDEIKLDEILFCFSEIERQGAEEGLISLDMTIQSILKKRWPSGSLYAEMFPIELNENLDPESIGLIGREIDNLEDLKEYYNKRINAQRNKLLVDAQKVADQLLSIFNEIPNIESDENVLELGQQKDKIMKNLNQMNKRNLVNLINKAMGSTFSSEEEVDEMFNSKLKAQKKLLENANSLAIAFANELNRISSAADEKVLCNDIKHQVAELVEQHALLTTPGAQRKFLADITVLLQKAELLKADEAISSTANITQLMDKLIARRQEEINKQKADQIAIDVANDFVEMLNLDLTSDKIRGKTGEQITAAFAELQRKFETNMSGVPVEVQQYFSEVLQANLRAKKNVYSNGKGHLIMSEVPSTATSTVVVPPQISGVRKMWDEIQNLNVELLSKSNEQLQQLRGDIHKRGEKLDAEAKKRGETLAQSYIGFVKELESQTTLKGVDEVRKKYDAAISATQIPEANGSIVVETMREMINAANLGFVVGNKADIFSRYADVEKAKRNALASAVRAKAVQIDEYIKQYTNCATEIEVGQVTDKIHTLLRLEVLGEGNPLERGILCEHFVGIYKKPEIIKEVGLLVTPTDIGLHASSLDTQYKSQLEVAKRLADQINTQLARIPSINAENMEDLSNSVPHIVEGLLEKAKNLEPGAKKHFF